ncbi:hypothetical protein LguiA_033167 [Lonicera macranthoides]
MLSYTNLSNKAFVFIITALCFIFLFTDTQAVPNRLRHFCSNTTTYTPSSTYQTNLNLLLSSLSSNSTNNGTIFSTSTAGRTPPNVAYGLSLCRGDVNTSVCSDCVATATREITTRCPNEKSAVTWYDECMLRYDNRSFFSTVEDQPVLSFYNHANTTEQAWFRQVLGNTIYELVKMASTDSPNDQFVNGFATREADVTSLQRIYGLAQCTQDLSNEECNQCLRKAISIWQLSTGTSTKVGDRILLPSCNIRYEIYPFYRELAPPALVPLPSSLTRPKGGKSSPPPSSLIIRKSKKSCDAVTDETDTIEITDVQSLQFDLGTIQVATNNFSNENKIGQGGFGYSCQWSRYSSKEAIKKLKISGYMSPEYAMHGHFSMGSDMFSFGVLVLEIISGKKNSYFHPSACGEDLLSHVHDGTPLELMDPTLADSHVRNEVIRCIQMGLLCVQEDVDSRPSMAAIVLMLGSYTVSLPLPDQPPFYFLL